MIQRDLFRRMLSCLTVLLALSMTACQAEPATQAAVPEAQPPAVSQEIPPAAQEPSVPEDKPDPADPELPPAPEEPDYLRHIAYMFGENGFFFPERPLSRAQTAQLLTTLFGAGQKLGAFTDVLEDRWYYACVACAADYLPGYEDGSFLPNANITPAEFVSAVLRASGTETEDPLAYAVSLGWLSEKTAAQAYVSRAQTATILNRALERSPDPDALTSLETPVFLDVPADHPHCADIMEAALGHAYRQEDGAEVWNTDSIQGILLYEGLHKAGGKAYYVNAQGEAVTQPGLLHTETATYLIAEDGQAWADEALHLIDGQVAFVQADGTLLKDGTWKEYQFNSDGFYTSGDEELDGYVAAVLTEVTTDDMTQAEKLRACYEYVRAFRYLGRNSALPAATKTIPMEKAVGYANKIFSTGKGDCYNFAASFCFLARALGYDATAIVGRCGYAWSNVAIAHGWVEIVIDGQTWLFDPQIENYNIRAGISNERRGAYQVTYETAPGRYYKN